MIVLLSLPKNVTTLLWNGVQKYILGKRAATVIKMFFHLSILGMQKKNSYPWVNDILCIMYLAYLYVSLFLLWFSPHNIKLYRLTFCQSLISLCSCLTHCSRDEDFLCCILYSIGMVLKNLYYKLQCNRNRTFVLMHFGSLYVFIPASYWFFSFCIIEVTYLTHRKLTDGMLR